MQQNQLCPMFLCRRIIFAFRIITEGCYIFFRVAVCPWSVRGWVNSAKVLHRGNCGAEWPKRESYKDVLRVNIGVFLAELVSGLIRDVNGIAHILSGNFAGVACLLK